MQYKIQSIKLIRAISGLTLKEAKGLIDSLDRLITSGNDVRQIAVALVRRLGISGSMGMEIAEALVAAERMQSLDDRGGSSLLVGLEESLRSRRVSGDFLSRSHEEYIKMAFSALIIAHRGSKDARTVAQEAIAFGRAMGEAMQALEEATVEGK